MVMSMYGDSSYCGDKNCLYDEIKWFLEEGHPVSELLQIVSDVLRYECEQNGDE